MRKIFVCLFALLLLFVRFLFPGSFSWAFSEFNVLAFVESDSGREVEVAKGDVVVILLREVETAGYLWEVVELDLDRLLFLSSESVKLSPPGMLGGENLRVFFLRAVASGKAKVKLVYRRPWESFKPPDRVFHLTLRVK